MNFITTDTQGCLANWCALLLRKIMLCFSKTECLSLRPIHTLQDFGNFAIGVNVENLQRPPTALLSADGKHLIFPKTELVANSHENGQIAPLSSLP
jgi:hypothetical protein